MFGYKYNWIFAGLLGIYSFLIIIILEGDQLFQANLSNNYLFIIIISLSFLVWYANRTIELIILPRLSKFSPLLVQFIFSFLIVSIISLFSVQVTGLLFGNPFDFSKQNLLLTGGFAFRINLFLNCLNGIFFFNEKFKQKSLEAEKLKTLTVSAQLESVNSQLNPHFFFNNLNALSGLIHQNVDQAEEYLQKMASIYRYVLANKKKELVPLADEFAFLQNYLDLLSIRFQKALIIEMEIDLENQDFFVAPDVLQLLVENIVKHNYFTEKKPLKIKISVKNKLLSVRNQKQLKDLGEKTHGVGLKNIRDRYTFLNENVSINDSENFFQVDFPLSKLNESITSRG